MPSYDHFDEMRARDLFMAGKTITEICARDDMPSRPVVTQWSKEGRGTDGIPWKEYREAREQQMILEAKEKRLAERASKGRDFLEEVKEDLIGPVYLGLIAKIQAGDFDVKLGDITEIVKLYAMLDNQASEKMEFAAWFVRKMFDLCLEIMDEKQFAQFKTKAMLLQHDVEAKLNPIDAAKLTG